MILDSNSVIDLALGSNRRQVEQGDNQLVLPNHVTIVVPIQSPTFVIQDPLVASEISFIQDLNDTGTNQAQADNTMATLTPGYWELEGQIAAWFNFNSAAAVFKAVQLRISIGGQAFTWLSIFAAAGSFTARATGRFLFRQQTAVVMRRPLTGVGESVNQWCSIRGSKLI